MYIVGNILSFLPQKCDDDHPNVTSPRSSATELIRSDTQSKIRSHFSFHLHDTLAHFFCVTSYLYGNNKEGKSGTVTSDCETIGWAASYTRALIVLHSIYHLFFYVIRSRDFAAALSFNCTFSRHLSFVLIALFIKNYLIKMLWCSFLIKFLVLCILFLLLYGTL